MVNWTITRYNCTPFFLKKKHFCLRCSTALLKKQREVVVNSESEEAKNYDFFVVDTYLYGNVKFITFYFECPNCSAVYEISELKKLEKTRKKSDRKNRRMQL